MKKIITVCCCLTAIIALKFNLSIQAKKELTQSVLKQQPNLKIAVLSDIHYMSPKLNPKGAAFEKYIANDRKLLAQSATILKETVNKIKKSDVNLVLVSGDLTKDGEEIDHKELANYLKEIEKTGKHVFVINGNHDILNPRAVSYNGNVTKPVKNISAEEFKKIYNDFGYKEAIAKDPNSLSYVVEPVKGLRIIAMDSCQYNTNLKDGVAKTAGAFSDKTLLWIKNQIRDAKKNKKTVIGMMHHGIVPHFSMQPLLCKEYLVKDFSEISSEFADLGMNVVFTGHFHTQDVSKTQSSKNNSIYDVETGSLVTYPCPYRIVELKNGNLNITTNKIVPNYSKQDLEKGIKGMAPQLIKELGRRTGMTNEQINSKINDLTKTEVFKGKTLIDVMIDTVISNYDGDEKLSPQVEALTDKMLESDDFTKVMIGKIIKDVGNDTAPSDNNLVIKLNLVH